MSLESSNFKVKFMVLSNARFRAGKFLSFTHSISKDFIYFIINSLGLNFFNIFFPLHFFVKIIPKIKGFTAR